MARVCLSFNGEKIKRYIQKRPLAQAEFAEDIGYDERTVRKWIHNGVYDYRLVEEIAECLGSSVIDLILE